MRVKRKAILGWIVGLILLASSPLSYGLDTDLYVLSGVTIPPNVLIILDNSASMDEVSSGQLYDPAINYSAYSPPTVYPTNAVYIKSGNSWVTWNGVCSDLTTGYLSIYGEAINYSNAGCGIIKKDFQTGNFRNYLQLLGGPGGSRPRFGLATGIIHSYINTTGGVRFGVMAFNQDSGGNVVKYDKQNPNKGEFVFDDSRDSALDANGGQLLGFVDENKNGKTALFQNLSSLKNETWSPLAETLSMGATYFQNGQIPVQYTCQKNYVLIISDGDPTKDTGAESLDEVAKSLFNLDLNGEKLLSKQNIKTYTIGFSMTHSLLESTARKGGGKYFYVYSSQSFNVAFQNFIAEVLQESTSYVAPVVPISQMEKTSAGNRMYLAMFKPTEKSFWKGNIKKYAIATKNKDGKIVDGDNNILTDLSIKVGDILDAKGKLIMDSENKIKDTAWSYWTKEADGPDGEDVEKGGLGKILQDRTASRNIYTYLGAETDLTHVSNNFNLNNTTITPALLGLASGDTVGREKVFNFVHGLDAYDWEGVTGVPDGITNVKRSWIQGALIHSRPLVIYYPNLKRSLIFVGSNGGMLQAFDDATGQELWGFIPPSLLPSLKNFNGEELQFFVDGAPKVYIERDASGKLTTGILIFGLRRGGNRYVAIDIRNPDNPRFLYEISPSTTGFGELGQTWSTPLLGKVKLNTGNKVVAFIGAGYDQNQDNQPVVGNDSKGRGLFVFDILNGNLIWNYTIAKNSKMTFSIPSDIARIDANGDGFIDRLYAGDMGGQMWRFDINDPDPTKWTGKVVFDSNPGMSQKRKIFYPPDVTLERGNFEMLFFGTGDREHPKNVMFENRIYAVKDTNSSETLVESNLVDVTDEKATLNALSVKSGWYIRLKNLGEKSLSHSVVFDGVVYYTTFTPTFSETGDICDLREGEGRLYALNYKSGNAVFNLDDSTDGVISQQTDQSTLIGPSIPSGVIVTFIGGTSMAYVGVGGGVYIPPLKKNKSIIPIHWKIVSK